MIDVGLSMDFHVRTVLQIINATNQSTPDEERYLYAGIHAVNFCIFLAIVVTSAHFLGCCTVLRNLICLPRFWTLIFLLALYVIGLVVVGPNLVLTIMEILHAFAIIIVLCFLNHVEVRNLVQGDSCYKRLVLKGALWVFFINWLLGLIGTIFNVYFVLSFIAPSRNNCPREDTIKPIMTFLTLPFETKITNLIWTKIFDDDKCIIGKYKSNSFDRQTTLIETL